MTHRSLGTPGYVTQLRLQLPDFSVVKTDRYRLAAALAGVAADELRWSLRWNTQHLLMLTAIPLCNRRFEREK